MNGNNPLADILEFYKDLGVTHLNLNPPSMESVEAGIKDCSRCGYSNGRKGSLAGWGSPRAELMFVTDALTKDSLLTGEPMTGEAWELLKKIIKAIDIESEEVFICNAVKCCTEDSGKPSANEIEACRPWLLSQIGILNPRVVVALGSVAAQSVLAANEAISSIRGRFYFLDSCPVMPTFHPEYLLHNAKSKADVWHDMKMVRERLRQRG